MSNEMLVEILDTPDAPQAVFVKGRNAWCLAELMAAGAHGCTPIERVGPRWSAYVFNLRKVGLDIATLHEQHGGDFPGNHGRYILRSRVRIVGREADKAAA